MTSDERLIADYSGTDLTIGKHPMEYRRAELRREKIPDQVRPGKQRMLWKAEREDFETSSDSAD
jgi:hypothetical protein